MYLLALDKERLFTWLHGKYLYHIAFNFTPLCYRGLYLEAFVFYVVTHTKHTYILNKCQIWCVVYWKHT